MEFAAERQTYAAWLGTAVGTIFGPVPPQETAVIMRNKWVTPATVGTMIGYLLSAPSLTGYSTMGTISPAGSIIDASSFSTIGTEGGGVDPDAPIAVVPPGAYLTGLTTAGSVLVVGVYAYRLGRSA
jgi:hypothetical protein